MRNERERNNDQEEDETNFIRSVLEDHLEVIKNMGWDREELYKDEEAEKLVERALPHATKIYREANQYFAIEEKAKEAAASLANEGKWNEARSAAFVSNFFRKHRMAHIALLRDLGGDPNVESYDHHPKTEKTIYLLENTPELHYPNLLPEIDLDEDEGLSGLIRRFGEF